MTMAAPRLEETQGCFLALLGGCSGDVKSSVCEGHSWKIFQIAWR